ncbi:MAG: TrkH family potassium uptake protein, partial [Deltaproteobacteria bacterium]|nr:TrkH family potassium uptake protein [Deltaproteobacteria bacterium]
IFLLIAGMGIFDAINHSLTTMSTGGFSTKNASVAGFNSPVVEWVITVFMFLAGINFALHFRFLFKGFDPRTYFKDSELSFYFWVTTLAVFSITFILFTHNGNSNGKIFRDASFTFVSILTTTGFGTVDYEGWPMYGQFILLFAMLLGGCAGSTSGGIKNVRILLVLKYMYSELIKLLHPSLVRSVKLGTSVVDKNVLSNILGFIFIYTFVTVISILLVSLETEDMVTAIGSVIASLGNIGPGFGSVGPTENYAHLGDFTKWILSLDMVMGRLEIFTILILFLPQTWKK